MYIALENIKTLYFSLEQKVHPHKSVYHAKFSKFKEISDHNFPNYYKEKHATRQTLLSKHTFLGKNDRFRSHISLNLILLGSDIIFWFKGRGTLCDSSSLRHIAMTSPSSALLLRQCCLRLLCRCDM